MSLTFGTPYQVVIDITNTYTVPNPNVTPVDAVHATISSGKTLTLYDATGFFPNTNAPGGRIRIANDTTSAGALTVSSVSTIYGPIVLQANDAVEYVSDGKNWYASGIGANSYTASVTPGTAAASKAVILGANSDIDLINFGAIGASDSSLGVNGQAAAQGGDVIITAGASSTATNAGGVATLKGGTGNTSGAGGVTNVLGGVGGATGIGGQVNVTGGVPTDAAGGAVVIAGGAGVGTNRAGGLASVTGGASTGSGTGGAASLVGGAAGAATGTGGAVSVTGGLGNTSGLGGAVSVTSGAGGSTSASGAITIASGTTTAAASGNVTIGSGNATGGVPGTTTVNAGAAQTAATAGGATAIAAGAGNTSGTGGAVTVTSGAGGATGASGTVTIASGAVTATGAAASGAISINTPAGATASGASTGGASGAITIQTNAGGTTGTGTGGAGGLVSILAGAGGLTTGAGTAGGAGGGLTFTAGAGGAGTTPTTGGAGGAVAITAGAGGNGTTSGAGGNVTVTAGAAGTGGNVAGGTINLIPGAAVGNALGGEVQINSVAGTFEVSYTAPLMTTAVPASGTAQPIYIATRAMRLKKAYCSVVTFNSSPTIQLTKDSSGTAPGGGTAMLAAVMTLAANNAPVTQAASATVATATLAAGDRISFLTGGTIGTSAGLTITMLLTPI